MKSHYAVRIDIPMEIPRKERNLQYRATRTKLAEAGHRDTTYFQFEDGDAKGKAAAKRKADALAAKIAAEVGVPTKVNEGMFL